MKQKLAIGLMLTTVATVAFAGPIEDQIRSRQAAYGFLGWNAAKIKAQVGDHPETYNKDQVIAAANAVAAVANSGVLDFYGEGTDQGTGYKPTRLKHEYFEKKAEVKDIEATFIKEANELQNLAAEGDVAAIKTQFGKVGAACKSCHDLIRVRE